MLFGICNQYLSGLSACCHQLHSLQIHPVKKRYAKRFAVSLACPNSNLVKQQTQVAIIWVGGMFPLLIQQACKNKSEKIFYSPLSHLFFLVLKQQHQVPKLLSRLCLIPSHRGIQGAHSTANFQLVARCVLAPEPIITPGSHSWHAVI